MLNIEDKQGYKYTEEFGYIPEDWEVKLLEDYISNKKYAIVDGPFGSNLKTEHYRKSGVPIVQSGFVTSNIFKAEDYLYVDKEKFQKEIRSKVEAGDIVMAKIGANCGTCAILPKEHPTSILAGNSLKISVDENSTEYLLYLFHRMLPLNMMEEAISRTAQPALSVGRLKKLKILVPPIPEQEKIAEVLGDVDSLIDKTQQLINKKKDLKTATMQKLLTPKEDWKWISFDELGTCISTSNLSWNDVTEDGVTSCILYGELFTTYNEIAKNIVSKTNITTVVAQRNDILFPTSTTVDNISLIAPSCLMEDNIGVGGDLFIFRPYGSNGIYLSYLINNYSEIKNKLANRAQGLTIIHLHYENIKDIKLPIPPIEEQDKIATILSDMDSEIEALEKELNKYKDLKIGMMQQLLTGKIRLIDKEIKSDSKVVNMESAKLQNKANDEFKDAVIISMLAYKFGSEKYPLGAFRRQKLSYLFKRHSNMPIDEYMKKAMGPYNPKMKYQGAEGIAIRNKYVKEVDGRGLVATDTISKVEDYYNRYFKPEVLDWLDKNFHYESNNNLEVLATVDYAIIDLKKQNREITLENIKAYIEGDQEWKPKLKLDYFTDSAIQKAMVKSKTLLNSY